MTPLLSAKKEVFTWVKDGKKTIDVRRGRPRGGDIAVFQSGRNHFRLLIVKRETGKLTEVVREDNYKQIIPSAASLGDALNYIVNLYEADSGVFTAYYLARSNE